ncbi:MAG TPA: DUF2993 domain-containing protein [Coleofasciculaceae cyanobacterium]
MISKLLSTAVKLYLRSQVERVEDLQVKILGKNKQILQGYIPQIFLSCSRAVYKGLYMRQIELNGSDIAFNLSEVMIKQPLKLLEPVVVEIQLRLDAQDLPASLDSPLLQSGLDDLWQMFLAPQQINNSSTELSDLAIEWCSIAIANQSLNFTGTYQDASGETRELCLSTGISLADSHTLCLSPLKINHQSVANELKIDLGIDVAIAQLIIESEQIICSGVIKIH